MINFLQVSSRDAKKQQDVRINSIVGERKKNMKNIQRE